MVLPLVLADVQAMDVGRARVTPTSPDEVAIVVVDVWTRIVMLIRREEEVAGRELFRFVMGEMENCGIQIRSLSQVVSMEEIMKRQSEEPTDRKIETGLVMLSAATCRSDINARKAICSQPRPQLFAIRAMMTREQMSCITLPFSDFEPSF